MTYHKIEPGKNIFRILPAYDGGSPFEEECKAFMKVESDIYKDGEPTGQKEIRNRPIFNAKIHGGNLESDPIDLYIKYVYRLVYDEVQDKSEREKLLAPITGYMNKGKYVPGLRPSTSYVYYAIKDGEIGLLQLYPNVTKEMEKLSFMAQHEDSPEMIDIFSDPDEGVNLEIYYDPKAKKDKYTVGKAEFNPKKFNNYEEFIESMRVSDEMLKKFSKLTPLKEKYRNVYTTRDFDLALDGLQRFDAEHEYGIFENEEFLDEVEELYAKVPEYKPKDKEEVEEDNYEEEVEEVEEKVEEKPTLRKKRKFERKAEEVEDVEEEVEEEVEEVPEDDIKARIAALRKKKK